MTVIPDVNSQYRYWYEEEDKNIRILAEILSKRRKTMLQEFEELAKKVRKKGLTREEAEEYAAKEIRRRHADYYVREEEVDHRRKARIEKLRELCEAVEIVPDDKPPREVDGCPAYAYMSQAAPLSYAVESLIPLKKYLEKYGVSAEIVKEQDECGGVAKVMANCEPYMADAANRRMTWEFMSEAWGGTVNPAVHIRMLPPDWLEEHWRKHAARSRT